MLKRSKLVAQFCLIGIFVRGTVAYCKGKMRRKPMMNQVFPTRPSASC
jgi:hypothetical protein